MTNHFLPSLGIAAFLAIITAPFANATDDYQHLAGMFGTVQMALESAERMTLIIDGNPDWPFLRECAASVRTSVVAMHDAIDPDRKALIELADTTDADRAGAMTAVLKRDMPLPRQLAPKSAEELTTRTKPCRSRKIDELVELAASVSSGLTKVIDLTEKVLGRNSAF